VYLSEINVKKILNSNDGTVGIVIVMYLSEINVRKVNQLTRRNGRRRSEDFPDAHDGEGGPRKDEPHGAGERQLKGQRYTKGHFEFSKKIVGVQARVARWNIYI
jgi:hypothetical protein